METAAIPQKRSIWDGGNQPMKASYGKLMMWFFLLSDAFTFSALLIVYGMIRFMHPAYEGNYSEFVFNPENTGQFQKKYMLLYPFYQSLTTP